jgi:hypothetical protein
MSQKKHPASQCFALGLMAVFLPITGFAFTKTGTTYTTDGSQADTAAAVQNASPNDTIQIPAGTFTWGANGTSITLTKPVTLTGTGTQSIINLAPNGPSWSGGVIRLPTAATVKNLTIQGANSGAVAAFACGDTDGWRITNITFKGGTDSAYFAYTSAGSGVIDNCRIDGANGSTELIFGRGPADSWQTPSSLGTSKAIYIEDCIFGGQGYVCDANSNARFVVRFCTINGPQKVDGHGKASNTPPRGVRHMEVYGNRWNWDKPYWTALEFRGGTGVAFDNTVTNLEGVYAWFYLREYGCTAQWPNFNNAYQTPANYPIDDQIGLGKDPKASASEPFYLWNNRDKSGADWPLNYYNDLAGASAAYGQPFKIEESIIVPNRDYFIQAAGAPFQGTSGVGTGTAAQMRAITPTKNGVGFWVTDEGEWNSRHAGFDGRLYIWNGTAWVLKYTPYTYPHPLTGAATAPAAPSATKGLRILGQ